jgi:alpha-amylase/alpha-mannosidase (GH57 family)
MAKKPLCVAFLWHMHQPDYGDDQTGEIYLPWTRFHALKDYYDMGALVSQTPGLHVTINMAPSLIDQLCSYGDGKARETYAALALRDAAELEEREKLFLLQGFFQLPWKQMILPYPRYRDLLERRGAPNSRGEYANALKRYSTQDFRDLQVWFNLSWCGNELRRNPAVAQLFSKGKNFTEEEKRQLLDIEIKFVGEVLPLYRRLIHDNGVELSVSPYYHPILPLLCENRSAREVLPDLPLPATPFAFPSDAAEQIRRAQQRFSGVFACPPAGMWPSEGAVSDAAAEAAQSSGLRWLASDEGVLYNSLAKSGHPRVPMSATDKYRAYQWRDTRLCLFFRDHQLSDLIGFTYAQWKAEDAVNDLLARLRSIHTAVPDDGRHYIVPIILDGENAWEHYPNNGTDFLTSLYRRLTESDKLRTVTFSEFLDLEGHRGQLKTLAAGSWIYSNLSTWIGHPEKNRAWDILASARQALDSCQREGMDLQQLEAAFHEVMIAEGSDWFWWFGDDHETQNAAEFDTLFRTHVKNVYRLLGKQYPLNLDVSIKRTDARALYRTPLHTISPTIDGKVTDYFEWLSAGFATPLGGESMHRTVRYLEKIFFGYDTGHFYLRIDFTAAARKKLPPRLAVELVFVSPQSRRLSLIYDEQGRWQLAAWDCPVPGLAARFAGGRIIESAIPLEALGVKGPEEVRFFIDITQNVHQIERFPTNGFLSVPVDPWTLDQEEWIV